MISLIIIINTHKNRFIIDIYNIIQSKIYAIISKILNPVNKGTKILK